ncbi:2-hydroxyacyl-CoA dehydratase family protein [Psychromarinibacter sp. C21-152]|uniref:2-hydroxyacyl-CoA dehydratase family protein n=1 Tax=Psychromarinibacter sediminicola TaxID=3033385 RepID=A0AAE3NPJ2_9RHOB|nr:2-hydroxyacyl-CoA dehydratase family protein [Psychromarinibacter sediminicola]MDF0599294.1 2-hydroxyacyl-CoA dehydratase family protein [Psychromarinibacter sediminicola]
MAARDDLHAAYAARFDLPAERGACIGCITQTVPLELVLAAGLRPVRLFPDPSRPPTRGDRYMEAEIDGEVRSLFDRMVAGAFAGLPLVLLPRMSEPHLQLHYYLAEVRTWEPEADIPPVQLVDIMQTAFWSTGRYVRARLVELADRLGGIGEPVTEDALRAAIHTVNRMRERLQALNALRRESRLKGSDLYRATALFGALSPGEFLSLTEALAADPGPKAGDAPRLMLSGCQQDDPSLYELIEAEGVHVAADDHVTGERVFAHLVDPAADPYDALAEHYQLHAPGLRQYPQKTLDDRFLAICRDARVDADLCVLNAGDDTLGWDWPGRRDRLREMGIPSRLLIAQDDFRPDRAAQTSALAALLQDAREGAA